MPTLRSVFVTAALMIFGVLPTLSAQARSGHRPLAHFERAPLALLGSAPLSPASSGPGRKGHQPPIAHIAGRHHRHHQRCAGHLHGRRLHACQASLRHRHGARRGSRASAVPHVTVALPAPTVPATPGVPPVAPATCTNGDLMPSAANLPVVESATLCLINQVRSQHGLAALRPNANLQSAAERHDSDMLARDYFAHTGPAGDTPLSRITDSGYLANNNGYQVGENIAWGTMNLATPKAIVDAWVNSPEHLANILTGAYVDSGLAVTAGAPPSMSGGQAGAIYTQDFGTINNG